LLLEQCAIELNQQLHRAFRVFLFGNLGFDFRARGVQALGQGLPLTLANPLLPQVESSLALA
jgi:hypothetical protein